jgi:hypothetical protein
MPILSSSATSGIYPDIAEKTLQYKTPLNARAGGLASAFFTLRASQDCWAGRVGSFVVAHSRHTNTTSWATSLLLQQSQLVNSPGKSVANHVCFI